jgi:transposase
MKRNQEYTSEFQAEAVKVVLTQGLSIAEAAKRLSVAKLEAQVSQLRKELAQAHMERDIL